MTPAHARPVDPLAAADPDAALLSPQELLAGSQLVHEVAVPAAVLNPGRPDDGEAPRTVRLRPLRIATLALIAKAAQDDAALVPLLMVKESLVAPALNFEQLRQLHAGLVQHLVAEVNRISGLAPDGGAVRQAGASAIGQAHLLLARHYGWTPQQVAELTPGQMAVYLADIGIADGADAAGGGL